MYKLLKKDESFNWTKACTRTFEWMKSSMTTLPILIVPKWKLEFNVHTDTSDFALGTMFS